MNKPLTLGSLFDGSGGFPLAGLLAGIVPVWSSEIEPFAIRVTEKRLPQVQHFGNISGLHGAKLPSVDIITFGSYDHTYAHTQYEIDGQLSDDYQTKGEGRLTFCKASYCLSYLF